MLGVVRATNVAALLVLGVVGFVLVAAITEQGAVERVDVDVANWAADAPDALVWLARPFSWIGGWIGVTLLVVVGCGWLVRERATVDLAFLLAAAVGSQVVVALLKAFFDRARPDVGSAVPLPDSAAFPSGHATAGIAAFGAVAVLVSERLESRRARIGLWASTAVLAIGIGLSRVALNVHFVTDVVAGWCLGLAWLAGCLLVRERFRRRG